MGLVPPMTPAADDLLGQGMVPPQTPHLGLDQLEHLHQLPAMENMGYDQVNHFFTTQLFLNPTFLPYSAL